MATFKEKLEKYAFFRTMAEKRRRKRREKEYRNWLKNGRPVPPPHVVKQKVVEQYARRFGLEVFVETGTYLGEMVDAVKDSFKLIHSIELSDELYDRACSKFAEFGHISIHHGDSAKVLPRLINEIDRPCLFWFDAHYSAGVTARGKKETPVEDELKAIFHHPVDGHVILIDDARCFTGDNDYPEMAQVRSFVSEQRPDHVFEVKDDIIRIHIRPSPDRKA